MVSTDHHAKWITTSDRLNAQENFIRIIFSVANIQDRKKKFRSFFEDFSLIVEGFHSDWFMLNH